MAKKMTVVGENKIFSNDLLCFIAVLWHFVGWNTSLVRSTC